MAVSNDRDILCPEFPLTVAGDQLDSAMFGKLRVLIGWFLILLTLTTCSDLGDEPVLEQIMSVDVETLDFGPVLIGAVQSRSLVISNLGEGNLDLSLQLDEGVVFTLTGVDSLRLEPDSSGLVEVNFQPASETTYSDTLFIFLAGSDNRPVGILLEGAGTPVPVPALSSLPVSLDFGSLAVGADSTRELVLSSIGTAPINLTQINLPTEAFTTTVMSLPLELAPDSSLTLPVTFSPESARDYFVSLEILSNAPDSPLDIDLFGNGYTILSWSSDVQPILNPSCGACHGNSGGLSIQSYTELMAGGDNGAAVLPGNGAGSLLVRRMRGDGGSLMPWGGPALADSTIQLIESWIDQGALDN